MSFETEKNIYVAKLERIIEGITKILDLKGNRIVNSEMISTLQSLSADAQVLLPKLKKGEFEIAVVGLEKAGKSSFSNALIGLPALPTADERCTYTSTCIRPGEENYAIVTFYSEQEFDRSFREKLEKLGIPDANNYTINNLSPDRYEQLYENCEDTIKRLYGNSLYVEIKDTLHYRDTLRKYIGSPKQRISGEELKSDLLHKYITNPSCSIAVKDVVIYSNELRVMPNAVMFDVPGFNSPTAMHEEQTLARMRAADAIIMVAKADAPSLTAEVLNIFKKSDVDGAYLSEKLFVFANKADRATDLQKNIATTYKEWLEVHRILPNTNQSKERIFFGSALADLNNDTAAKEKMGEKPGTNIGIDNLRQALVNYYDSIRFEVLKKRVNKILVDVKQLFAGEDLANPAPYDSTKQYEIIMELRRELSDSISRELETLKYNLNTKALKDRPLSSGISEDIKSLVTVENYEITPDDLELVHKEKIGIGMAEMPQLLDGVIRERRFTQMYGDFMRNVLNCTGSQHSEVCEQILKIFLNAMNLYAGSRAYDAIRDDVKNLCDFGTGTDDAYYQSLIERFGRDVFEVQIKFSQGIDRWKKFKEEATNFSSLGIFYCTPDDNADLPIFQGADSPLWKLLLYPENAAAAPKSDVAEKLMKLTGLQNVNESVDKLLNQVMALNGVDTMKVIEKAFKGFLSTTSTQAAILSGVKEVFHEMLESMDDSSTLLREILTGNRYQMDIAEKHSSYSYEQLRQEFNDDIRALQLVLQNAVISAIGIDKAFSARESKLIEDIIGMLKGDRFDAFIARNAAIIKATEFGQLKEEEAQRSLDLAVKNEIHGILSSLE